MSKHTFCAISWKSQKINLSTEYILLCAKMSSFKPNKRHFRELLIYFFNVKKSAAEAHRLLIERYGEAALSERSCREWFQNFKNIRFRSFTINAQFLIKNDGNLFVHLIIYYFFPIGKKIGSFLFFISHTL